jgi:hypothetical protein
MTSSVVPFADVSDDEQMHAVTDERLVVSETPWLYNALRSDPSRSSRT